MNKLAVIIISLFAFTACTQQKIGYVDSVELMKEYKAVKNLEKEIEEKQQALQVKYQQVAVNFQKEVQEFQAKSKRMSPKKGQARYEELMQKQAMIQQNQQAESAQLQQESQEKMNDIIDDVKAFAKDYAKQKGYTYILGANESGNVLFGDVQLDLTEEMLVAINKKYKETSSESEQKEKDKKEIQKDSIK